MKSFWKVFMGALALSSLSLSLSVAVKAGTSVYVGRDVSKEDTTIIAGNTDDSISSCATISIVPRNENAEGELIMSEDGFVYALPSTSFQYQIITNMDGGIAPGAINEYGLAVSVTGCKLTNDAAKEADPFRIKGIDRSVISSVIASSCRNAKEAVELVASIIDVSGCKEGMILMVADQKEAWYMEMYTGYQYAAVKMPRNCVAVFGDEYSLVDISADYDDVITSENIESLPKENKFVRYYKNEDINLYETYSGKALREDIDYQKKWYGRIATSNDKTKGYNKTSVYPLFFEPEYPIGVSDIFTLLRSRYEGTKLENDDSVDKIGIGNSDVSESHVIQVVTSTTGKMADIMWFNPAGSTFSPYVPIGNSVDAIPESFSMLVEDNAYNSKSAAHSLARLSAIANRDDNVGKGVRNYWECCEDVYIEQYLDKLSYEWDDLYSQSPDEAQKAISEFCQDIMKNTYEDSDRLYDEALWYMMKGDKELCEETNALSCTPKAEEEAEEIADNSDFQPGFDVEKYAQNLGWEYKEIDNKILLTKDGENIVLEYNEENNAESSVILNAQNSLDTKDIEVENANAKLGDMDVSVDITFDIPEEVEAEFETIKSAFAADINDYIEEFMESVPEEGMSKEQLLDKLEEIKQSLLEISSIEFSHYVEDIPFDQFGDELIKEQALIAFDFAQATINDNLEGYFDKAISSIDENLSKEELTKKEVEVIIEGLSKDINNLADDILSTDIESLILNQIDVQEIENLINEAADALVCLVKDYTGVDLYEISDEEVLQIFEEMDPESKEILGDIFGVNIDELVIEYREAMAQTENETKKEAADVKDEVDKDTNEAIEEVTETEITEELIGDELTEELAEDDFPKEGLTEEDLSEEALEVIEEAIKNEENTTVENAQVEESGEEAPNMSEEEENLAATPKEEAEASAQTPRDEKTKMDEVDSEDEEAITEEIILDDEDEIDNIDSEECFNIYLYKVNGKIYASPYLMKILINSI